MDITRADAAARPLTRQARSGRARHGRSNRRPLLATAVMGVGGLAAFGILGAANAATGAQGSPAASYTPGVYKVLVGAAGEIAQPGVVVSWAGGTSACKPLPASGHFLDTGLYAPEGATVTAKVYSDGACTQENHTVSATVPHVDGPEWNWSL